MSRVDPLKLLLGRRVFAAVKRPIWQAVYALTGQRLQAQTEYFDFGMYGGYFEAESKSVQARLPPGFEVIEHRAGFTELEIWCAQYRRMDILRPYNELGVLVPVHFTQEGMPPLTASFVLEMPVTSEEARWSGVDIYGFPKILADITIVDEGTHTRCQVRHRGVDVLSMRVEAHAARPFENPVTLLNVRGDGHVIECLFDTSGERSVDAGLGGVSLELGQHAIAEELRQMGVRAASGRGLYMPRARATLGIGVDLGKLPPRPIAPPARVSGATNGRGAVAAH